MLLHRLSAPIFFPYCPGPLGQNFSVSEKVGPHSGLTFSRFGVGLFRRRNANLFAAPLILLFSQPMIHAINAASKLCAVRPRHAQVRRLSAVCLRSSTWQGGGNPLRCILPRCRKRHAETVPVSAPFGLRGATAFYSWAVRP